MDAPAAASPSSAALARASSRASACGPVGDLRRVAGGDAPVDLGEPLSGPLGNERRRQLGQASRSSTQRMPSSMAHLDEAAVGPGDLERHDLPLERTRSAGGRRLVAARPGTARRGPGGRCPTWRRSARRDALGHQTLGVAGARTRSPATSAPCADEPIGTRLIDSDPGGDHHVVRAGEHALGGEVDRLLATSRTGGRPWWPAPARDSRRPAHRGAGDVHRLLARPGSRVPTITSSMTCGIDARALHQGAQRVGPAGRPGAPRAAPPWSCPSPEACAPARRSPPQPCRPPNRFRL